MADEYTLKIRFEADDSDAEQKLQQLEERAQRPITVGGRATAAPPGLPPAGGRVASAASPDDEPPQMRDILSGRAKFDREQYINNLEQQARSGQISITDLMERSSQGAIRDAESSFNAQLRTASRRERLQTSLDLARASSSQERVAVLEGSISRQEEGSDTSLRLQAQLAREQRAPGETGGSSRALISRRFGFLAAYGLIEAARGFGATTEAQFRLPGETNLQQFQAQQQAAAGLTQGLIGSLAAAPLQITDALAFMIHGDRYSGTTFGGLITTPYGIQRAGAQARQGLEAVSGRTQAILEGIRYQRETADIGRSAQRDEIPAEDRVRQQLFDARTRETQAGQEMQDRVTSLQQQIDDAQTAGDSGRARGLQAQLDQLNRDAPARADAVRRRFGAEVGAVERGLTRARSAIARRDPEISARIELQFGRAGELEFERGLQDQEENTDEAVRPQVQSQDERLRAARGSQIAEEVNRRNLHTGENLLRLRRQPLLADIAHLTLYRLEELQNSRNSAEEQSINTDYDIRERLVRQQYADQTAQLNLGFSTRAALLNARFNPNRSVGEITAEVESVVGRTRAEEQHLRQAGRGQAADTALLLGKEELRADRLDYLRSFRAEQVDLYHFRPGPRDQEDVSGALKEFGRGSQQLGSAQEPTKVSLSDEDMNRLSQAFADALRGLVKT